MNSKLDYKDLGSRIRMLRQEMGSSQAQFAELLGVKQPFISPLEKGKLRPTLQHLTHIASLTGKSLDWMVWGEGLLERQG